MLWLKKGVAIIIGSILVAIGINLFLIPHKVLDGGVIGLGLIVNYLWGIEPGKSIILLSIPVFVLAWFKYRAYFYNSLHGLLVSSLFIDCFNFLEVYGITASPAWCSILGGVLVGIGIGIMLKYKTSTGGTDLIAQFISDLTGFNVGMLIFTIDIIVISIGGFLFAKETFLLSALAVLSVGLATSMVTWGKQA
ncbi:YitT family protein [Bacillus sp. EB01]|uniref:YitT family protein n=1 Tax=Bacillus sp. EB01 TaxID=1347086 RepID=UPI0005C465D4|nr:YitT family protein [Bacillus sp. EB01]